MSGTAPRSEMEIGIEAGFAHRAVTAVVVGGEAMPVQPIARANFRSGDIATGRLQGSGLRLVGMLRRLEEIPGILRRMRQQPADHAHVVVAVLRFDNRTVTEIEIPRQSGIAGE